MQRILIFLFLCSKLVAQTYVGGGIYTNTKWVLANSPYIDTSALTVFPNDTLTIDPGVVIKFNNGVGAEIRGALIAVGTSIDSIIFTSSSPTPTQGIWQGITVNNTLGGKAQIQYSSFRYAYMALQNVCCGGGGPLTVRNSLFNDNFYALYGYTGSWKEVLDSCYFTSNYYAVTNADKTISNSVFEDNQYGFYETERIDVSSCDFCSNKTALYGGRGTLQNSIIMNNGVGVRGFWEGFYNVTGNIIAKNDTGIIITTTVSPAIGTNNTICSNLYYNMINAKSANVTVPNNCWCDTSSSYIESKIYDGYDNVSLGLISFTPVLNCDSLSLPVAPCQNFITTGIISQNQGLPLINIFPNPASNKVFVTLTPNLKESLCQLYTLTGQQVWSSTIAANTSTFEIPVSNLNNGIYFLKLQTGDGSTLVRKVEVVK